VVYRDDDEPVGEIDTQGRKWTPPALATVAERWLDECSSDG
jgi:hypothetical protein